MNITCPHCNKEINITVSMQKCQMCMAVMNYKTEDKLCFQCQNTMKQMEELRKERENELMTLWKKTTEKGLAKCKSCEYFSEEGCGHEIASDLTFQEQWELYNSLICPHKISDSEYGKVPGESHDMSHDLI